MQIDRDVGYGYRRIRREDSRARWRGIAEVLFRTHSGIEATGSMQWFLEWMEELSIECRVGQTGAKRDGESQSRCSSKARNPTLDPSTRCCPPAISPITYDHDDVFKLPGPCREAGSLFTYPVTLPQDHW
jgi:hypothetical protein